MPTSRVFDTFSKATNLELEIIVNAVFAGMGGNSAFPTPPVSLHDKVSTALTSFSATRAAHANGDMILSLLRRELVGYLLKLATYVEGTASTSAQLLSSGFEEETIEPQIKRVDYGPDGQLILTMQPVCNATRYEARVRLNHAQWLPSRFFDSARAMVLDGLPQRTLCIVQVRAIPDSKEPTDWSAPVSRMTL